MACGDGESALEAVEQASFHLVVLDVALRGSDGLEVCRQIRNRSTDELPVIVVVTAQDGAQALEPVLSAGADDFIPKPVEIGHFELRVAMAEREAGLRAERTGLRHGLQATTHELEAFAYSVAHDLRTPLRTITGFSHLLLDEDLSDQGRDFVSRIVAAGHRAELLITDLLAYSRVSLADLELEQVDIEEILTHVRDDLQIEIDATGASITVEGTVPPVHSVGTVLQQALRNLVSNAIKFVREGERPEIRIVPEQLQNRLRVYVVDNGIGVPDGQTERIFGVFERLPGQTSIPGTGIGLAIVRRGLERIGGAAGVERRESGSAFWIEVPHEPTWASWYSMQKLERRS